MTFTKYEITRRVIRVRTEKGYNFYRETQILIFSVVGIQTSRLPNTQQRPTGQHQGLFASLFKVSNFVAKSAGRKERPNRCPRSLFLATKRPPIPNRVVNPLPRFPQ